MLKEIAFILSLSLLFGMMPLSSTAADSISTDNLTEELINDTIEYVDNELIVLTNYLVDLSEYEGEGPFDFNGVDITHIEPLFNAESEESIANRIEKMGYLFSYTVTVSDSVNEDAAVTL